MPSLPLNPTPASHISSAIVPAHGIPRDYSLVEGAAASFRAVHYFYTGQYFSAHPELRPHAKGNMTYHGGPVQNHPHIYLLFFGRSNNRSDPVHDPDNVFQYGYHFLKGVEGSAWLKTVTQYSSSSGRIADSRREFKAAWYDRNVPDNPMTGGILAQEALRFIAVAKYDPQGNYVIMTPSGYTMNGFGTKFCAFHTVLRTTYGDAVVTLLPYVPDVARCGRGSVNKPGVDDGVSINLGHEVAEAQTDPLLSAWYGPGPGSSTEIGDKCAWKDLRNTTLSTGHFPTQPLWSNKARGCVNP